METFPISLIDEFRDGVFHEENALDAIFKLFFYAPKLKIFLDVVQSFS